MVRFVSSEIIWGAASHYSSEDSSSSKLIYFCYCSELNPSSMQISSSASYPAVTTRRSLRFPERDTRVHSYLIRTGLNKSMQAIR